MSDGWSSPAVLAAFLSAVAAIAAAIAAWRGPRSAALIAERLRRESEGEQESRRFRLQVFSTIMQSRAEIYSEDSVKALNSIDVAFSQAPLVRESWAELLNALNTPSIPSHVVEERLRKLLREMADDLGLSKSLRQDDFGRVYFPNAIAEARNLNELERRASLQRLMGTSSPAANAASEMDPEMQKKWPPRPPSGDGA
ncbi:MAG TPA: DUF6680 family protein [Allosphingosinicella sp.]|jgi:hypothetical protein